MIRIARNLCAIAALTIPLLAAAEQTPAYRISGPYTHANLSVFLVHGSEAKTARPLLTLDEALKQHKVIVHETGNVNQLAVENVSSDDVFLQSGDIVKGGQQDRTLETDLI